ncbi:MAG: class I SAM-dependent methyltransferase [Ilumatobacteraceae bacterium]
MGEIPGTNHAYSLEFTGYAQRVLELGCAAGHVTAALKGRNHYVVAVEVDPESAAVARSVADRVYTADLDVASLATVVNERDFDVILMGDVLEHLRDPWTVLRESSDLLRPGGCVVISLPNVAFIDVRLALLEGRWTYKVDGLLDATHVRFFTRRTLFELAEQAGFVVTEFRRVTKPRDASNVAAADPWYPPVVAEVLDLDPNASTYQFVVRLERESEENRRSAAELRAALDAEEAAAADLQRRVARSFGADVKVLEQSREELIALQQTRLFRYAQVPRRLYRWLRSVGRRR